MATMAVARAILLSVVIRQCAWCGAVKCFGHHVLPGLPRVELQWRSQHLEVLTSHGVCRRCLPRAIKGEEVAPC